MVAALQVCGWAAGLLGYYALQLLACLLRLLQAPARAWKRRKAPGRHSRMHAAPVAQGGSITATANFADVSSPGWGVGIDAAGRLVEMGWLKAREELRGGAWHVWQPSCLRSAIQQLLLPSPPHPAPHLAPGRCPP